MNYNRLIEFEWDELKSNVCFQERGFDFAYAARVFFDPNRIMRLDTRQNYGEHRFQVMGEIDDRLFVVVYTPRRSAVRILSARKANRREVQYYENRTNEN